MLAIARCTVVAFAVLASACHDDEPTGAPIADASDLDASDLDASDLDASDADAGGSACRDAPPLRCGDRLSNRTTAQGEALWRSYSCTARAEPAPEAVYALETAARCQVGVRLSELETDVDLFVLDDCDPLGCSEVASTPLDLQTEEAVDFHAESGRAYVVVVDGYDESGGSYDLSVDCLCGDGDFDFSYGDWQLKVDRRWHGDSLSVQSTSAPLAEEDYEAVADGPSYPTSVSRGWSAVSVGDAPWIGALVASPDGTLSYELTGGSTGAGGRLIVWVGTSGLQAELTHYGSGVPIVSSERGALTRAR